MLNLSEGVIDSWGESGDVSGFPPHFLQISFTFLSNFLQISFTFLTDFFHISFTFLTDFFYISREFPPARGLNNVYESLKKVQNSVVTCFKYGGGAYRKFVTSTTSGFLREAN